MDGGNFPSHQSVHCIGRAADAAAAAAAAAANAQSTWTIVVISSKVNE